MARSRVQTPLKSWIFFPGFVIELHKLRSLRRSFLHFQIPYWWRVTSLIWVVLLIGWSKSSDVHSRENHLGRVAKCRMFSQAMGFQKKKHRQLYASEWGQIKNKFCCNIFKNTPNFPLNVTLDTQAWWKENPTIIFSERKMNSIYMCITLESSLQSSSKTLVL